MLVCLKCGAEVPATKLVCDCFQVQADRERAERSAREYLMGSGRGLKCTGLEPIHVLIATDYPVTLCLKRFMRVPGTDPLGRYVFDGNRKPLSFCSICWESGRQLIADVKLTLPPPFAVPPLR